MNNIRHYAFWAIDALKGGQYKKTLAQYKKRLKTTSPEDISTIQKASLKKLLQHAISHVSFYEDISSAELENFPIVRKEIMRKNMDSFLSKTAKKSELINRFTSGSSGTSFNFFYDKRKYLNNRVAFIYHNNLVNYSIGDRILVFRSWTDRTRLSKIKSFAQNQHMIDCNVTNESTAYFLEQIKGNRNTLFGYVSGIVGHAENIERELISGVTGIVTGSEMLTNRQRSFLHKKFRCPVFSRYSNEEQGLIAEQFSMDTDKFRVNWPMIVVEILKLDSDEWAEPGEIGRVVLTDLTNYSFPFIRYDTGDLCSYDLRDKVGNVLLYMNNIEGRALDFLYTPKGERLTPYRIENLPYWSFNIISDFQLMQEGEADYRMRVVVKKNFNENDLRQELVTILGPDANITIEQVLEIPPLPSGKRPPVINLYKKEKAGSIEI